MTERALPFELRLAVGIALGEALAAARRGKLVHLVRGMAQPRVRAALAPVALADGVRHRAPAMALGALPFHQRQAVAVDLREAAAAAPGGVALDFLERELAHRSHSSGRCAQCGRTAPGAAVMRAGRRECAIHLPPGAAVRAAHQRGDKKHDEQRRGGKGRDLHQLCRGVAAQAEGDGAYGEEKEKQAGSQHGKDPFGFMDGPFMCKMRAAC